MRNAGASINQHLANSEFVVVQPELVRMRELYANERDSVLLELEERPASPHLSAPRNGMKSHNKKGQCAHGTHGIGEIIVHIAVAQHRLHF
ncbi:hypothetical protein J6590_091309 [Homalodisca vitripennis]|nr:hypothetical protein J6590_091309 [Homalodisca vitripennis]